MTRAAVGLLALLLAAAPAAAAPPAELAGLVPDVEDAAVVMVVRDGAVFIGDAGDVVVVGRDDTAGTVDAGDSAGPGGDSAGAFSAADVAWTSAPAVAARARLRLPAGATIIARAGGAPLLVFTPRGAVLAADLAAPANGALRRWGYLPYVLHAACAHARGRPIPRFAAWRHSPVPHRPLVVAWAATIAALAAALALAFAFARRRARAHPDAHVAFFARLAAPPPSRHGAAWTRPGIARPLGGFFMFISATLLAMGPYLYVTVVLVPSRVQPFPDADGAWAPIEDFATFCWVAVDFGMTVAFVKHFAQWRVTEPKRALAAAQAYFWWQLAGGLLLASVGGAFACGVLPHTHFALFARIVLIRAVMQVPGVFSFFTNFFQAIQRFDFHLLLDLLEKRLLFVAVPIPFILWFRALGRAHPALGEPFGAILGIAAGQYGALLLTAAFGFLLFRRLRLPLAPLGYAGFDRTTVAPMLRFGAGIVAGKAPYFFANAVEFAIITALLPGYIGWLGIRQLIMARLIFTIYFVWPFIDSAIPAVAEALAAKKYALTRYYVVRYLQFGQLFGAVVVAVLLGAGRALVLRSLPAEWRPVATYLPLACAQALLLPPTWLADAFLRAGGRPGLDSAILVTEQAIRVLLFWLLIPQLGFAGIFVAMFATTAVKTAVAWIAAGRAVLPLQVWPWTSTLAPLAAGALVYLLCVGAAALLPVTRAAGLGLFVAAALAAFPLGFFFVGLIGGLDPAAVDELAGAAELASGMRPVARLLARAGALGARLGPRRPLPSLAAAAQADADAIARVESAQPS